MLVEALLPLGVSHRLFDAGRALQIVSVNELIGLKVARLHDQFGNCERQTRGCVTANHSLCELRRCAVDSVKKAYNGLNSRQRQPHPRNQSLRELEKAKAVAAHEDSFAAIGLSYLPRTNRT